MTCGKVLLVNIEACIVTCRYLVPLYRVGRQPSSYVRRLLRPTLSIPGYLIMAIFWLTLPLPVVAFGDDHYVLAHIPTRYDGRLLAFFFVIGSYVVILSKNSLGPLMGISSILWVMMRNDPAISPKLSWM
ncbi:hypothetical protein CC78DRAFT_530695 [Lojkania enalia]|uniref:Uncharacterized protein n=1 Tax=Lojkania enalia TaxID=147567 RepID=A0A9P4KJ01_9PLEO|nr:hypothetical protein CC78DRAFT_530695 [Didymosphaeria enalia]